MVFFILLGFNLIMLGICISVAQMRNGSSVLGQRPRRIRSLTTALSPQETLKIIIRTAQHDGYKIPAIDLENDQLVLEEPTSVMSWGFFFPVIVSQQSDRSTLVEIGIMSKLIQFGPIVTRSHDQCVNGIKAALFARNRDTGEEA